MLGISYIHSLFCYNLKSKLHYLQKCITPFNTVIIYKRMGKTSWEGEEL